MTGCSGISPVCQKKNKTLKNKTKCFAVPTSQIHFFLHPHLLFGFLCVFWKFDFMQYWIKLIRVIFLCVLKPKVPTLKSNVIHILKKKNYRFPFSIRRSVWTNGRLKKRRQSDTCIEQKAQEVLKRGEARKTSMLHQSILERIQFRYYQKYRQKSLFMFRRH